MDGGAEQPSWDCENTADCEKCNGTGKDYTQNLDGHPEICENCGGTGWVCADDGEHPSEDACHDCLVECAQNYREAMADAYS